MNQPYILGTKSVMPQLSRLRMCFGLPPNFRIFWENLSIPSKFSCDLKIYPTYSTLFYSKFWSSINNFINTKIIFRNCFKWKQNNATPLASVNFSSFLSILGHTSFQPMDLLIPSWLKWDRREEVRKLALKSAQC